MPQPPKPSGTTRRHVGMLAAGLSAAFGFLVVGATDHARPTAAAAPPTCEGRPATIVGGAGSDRLVGTINSDVIWAGAGNDVVYSYGGDDVVCAGDGNDFVSAGDGRDVVDGGAGTDEIRGGWGWDGCRNGEVVSGCDYRLPSPTAPATTAPATTAPATTAPATTAPATTAPATTAPATTAPPPGAGDFASVPSNFDMNAWLATGERIPASSASEPSGNFRTFCGFSHLSYDDPIIYPGQTGAAHLHMFFGNTLADANSTYRSLRSSGSSTCQGGPLNRTGYWIPAVHNAAGRVVVPDYFELYYKGNGTQAMINSIRTNPNGLRMIAGYDAANPNAIRGEWSCGGGASSTTLPSCASGQALRMNLRFPMCWNGQAIDSANHRSHMAYGTGGGGWVTSTGGCPSTHPIHLPELTLIAVFPSDGDTRNWYLASDRMPGMAAHPNGSTFHADWFGAWDNTIQETWTQECIREMRNCVWGELGNGTRLRDYSGTYTGPRLISPPAR